MPDDPSTTTSAASPAEPRRLNGPLALAAITLGMLTWPIAFNLGAYGEIFYNNIFQVVVASAILLVIVVVNDDDEGPRRWAVRLALAAPMVWLLAAGYVVGSTSEALGRPAFAVSLGVILAVSVPLTLSLLVDVSMPQLSRAGSRRVTMSIVALVVALGLIGFAVGRQHPRFLTCSDFSIAGSAEPENCAR